MQPKVLFLSLYLNYCNNLTIFNHEFLQANQRLIFKKMLSSNQYDGKQAIFIHFLRPYVRWPI